MVGPLKRGAVVVTRGGVLAGALGLLAAFRLAAASPSPALVDSLRSTDDPERYVTLLDRVIYADLVAGLAPDARAERPPLDLDELRESLGSATALIALHPVGNEVFGAVIGPDGLATHHHVDARVPVMAARLRTSIRDPERELDLEAATVLHEALLDPLADELAGAASLVVVPSGRLRGLPFEAFVMAPVPGVSLDRQPLLVKRWAVGYEATLGSRLLWADAKEGRPHELRGEELTLFGESTEVPFAASAVIWAELPPRLPPFSLALGLARRGAAGALLGPEGSDLALFLPAYERALAGGRRPAASALRLARLAILREHPEARPQTWLSPLLFGCR